MINDPRECAFYPNPTSKFQTCTLLDISKHCTPEHACKCSFGLTPRELRQSTLHAYERLASLDLTDQDYIANKYYGGKMPWKEIANGRQKV